MRFEKYVKEHVPKGLRSWRDMKPEIVLAVLLIMLYGIHIGEPRVSDILAITLTATDLGSLYALTGMSLLFYGIGEYGIGWVCTLANLLITI